MAARNKPKKGHQFRKLTDVSVPLKKKKKAKAVPVTAEDVAWQQSFRQFEIFHRQHGYSKVPARNKSLRPLAAWVALQQELQARGKLRPDRLEALVALDPDEFCSDAGHGPSRSNQSWDIRWNRRFEELVAFQREHGHTRVSENSPDMAKLANWRKQQKMLKQKGKLAPERVALLEAIDFDWVDVPKAVEASNRVFNDFLNKLQLFKEHFGHTRVPREWQEDVQLARWTKNQSQHCRTGRIKGERLALLNSVGFDWSIPESFYRGLSFNDYLNKLHSFKERFGHARVPHRWKEDKDLASWVGNQRNYLRKGWLNTERIALLDSVGFVWKVREKIVHALSFNDYLKKLLKFKKRFGHTRVSQKWQEDLDLARWVSNQRQYRKRGVLTPERIALLDSVGFVWKRGEKIYHGLTWNDYLKKLKIFKKRFGHTRVRFRWKEDIHLANWVTIHRRYHKIGALKPDQIAQLDAIGFEWVLRSR